MKEEFALKHKVKWSTLRLRHGEKTTLWPSLHGPTWGPHFIWTAQERESSQREREIKRGKGGGESVPLHSPLSIFVSSFCARSTHTLTVQWISNLALISCAPDETNTDSLFTFVKAPAAAVLVPHTHTPCVHTNTHNLWIWGLAPAGAYRKSRLCTKWPRLHWATLCRALLLFSLKRIHKHTHTHCVCVSCFVSH